MRTFTVLSDAVSFIASAVESGEHSGLAEACHDSLPQQWVMDRLREINAVTPLIRIYEGWEFPGDASEFKLGGHAKELGHIHIDFVRTEAGWEIKQIWMCR